MRVDNASNPVNNTKGDKIILKYIYCIYNIWTIGTLFKHPTVHNFFIFFSFINVSTILQNVWYLWDLNFFFTHFKNAKPHLYTTTKTLSSNNKYVVKLKLQQIFF